MTPEDKLRIELYKLVGNFVGTLEGICACDIPEDLKKKLQIKIKELNEKYP